MESPITLQANEEIISLLRRHPMRLIGQLLATAVVVILVFVLWRLIGQGEGMLGNIMDIVMIVAVIGGIIAALIVYYRYQNDVWLITNKRLVDIVRSTPFNQRMSSADLTNVQDISVRKRGVFQSMFDYGDVRCQTASGASQTFEFRGIPHPEKVLDEIDQAREHAQQARLKAVKDAVS